MSRRAGIPPEASGGWADKGLRLTSGRSLRPSVQSVNCGLTAAMKLRCRCVAMLLAAACAQAIPPAFAAPQGAGGGQQGSPGGGPPSPAGPSAGAPASADERPYDAQVMRLAELLGAVHYLRALCGGSDGQAWRNQMMELVTSEGATALRRARLVESFNKGYRSYARTYRSCTQPAAVAIAHFFDEGAALTEGLAEQNK